MNVDGLEWRRNKFSCGKCGFLYLSDRLAQFFAHCVIVDNEALRPYLILAVRKSAVFIPYPGDHARLHNVPSTDHENPYCLTICRIEPENNCHVLLAAFAVLWLLRRQTGYNDTEAAIQATRPLPQRLDATIETKWGSAHLCGLTSAWVQASPRPTGVERTLTSLPALAAAAPAS